MKSFLAFFLYSNYLRFFHSIVQGIKNADFYFLIIITITGIFFFSLSLLKNAKRLTPCP